MRGLFKRLRDERQGSVIVEFALIAPVFIGMLLGVIHIGIAMQNYNALRGISGDVARYAVVNYQTNNRLSKSQLEDYANGLATNAPYGLSGDRFEAEMSPATTQRVAGAVEYTLSLTYQVPTMLNVLGIDEVPISFSRPVFVIASTT
mgnify:CR=1 FL=1